MSGKTINTVESEEFESQLFSRLLRILIVDDDISILTYLKAVLERSNYVVVTAKNGKEALKKCEEDQYDLTLLDMKLPDMDGTQLLEKLKKYPSIKIMITGYPTSSNVIESLNLGADAFLVKPVKPRDLLENIEKNLKKYEKVVVKAILAN